MIILLTQGNLKTLGEDHCSRKGPLRLEGVTTTPCVLDRGNTPCNLKIRISTFLQGRGELFVGRGKLNTEPTIGLLQVGFSDMYRDITHTGKKKHREYTQTQTQGK